MRNKKIRKKKLPPKQERDFEFERVLEQRAWKQFKEEMETKDGSYEQYKK